MNENKVHLILPFRTREMFSAFACCLPAEEPGAWLWSAGSTSGTGRTRSTPRSASTSTARSVGSGSGSRSSRTCYGDYLEYYEEGRLDPVLVRIELTVDGDGIVADFAGSNPQVPGVVNSSFAVTGAGVFVAVKSTLDPDSTRSGAACSGSARAMRWSCAASHSPARRAAWPILRRSRIASRIGGAGGASNLGCPCAPSVDSMVTGRENEVNHGARRARVLRNRPRRLRKADPYAGAGAPGTGSLAMRFTSL